MAFYYLEQMLYPSGSSASESQRGRKRCGGGGPAADCDKKKATRRAHWEAHFGHHHGPHGPWGHHHPHHHGGHWGVPASRGMPIDFLEKEDGFELLADIPGVDKSDIKLNVDGDVLSIKVDKNEEEATTPAAAPDADAADADATMGEGENGQNGANGGGNIKYHQHERSTEFPARAVRFPDTADLANVKASYVNGVLKLEVAKLPVKEPQQITIA